MGGKKKARIFISIVICFLLGAAPMLAGIHFEWPVWQSVLALLIMAAVVSPIAFKTISGVKTMDDEDED